MNSPFTSRRLNAREVVNILGLANIGELTRLRSKGSRQYDPTFPQNVGSFFIENEVLAWKKSKEDAPQELAAKPTTKPQAHDRRSGMDRRKL